MGSMGSVSEKRRATAEDYWSLPEGTRAELIDGGLWDLASPSRLHQELSGETRPALGEARRAW